MQHMDISDWNVLKVRLEWEACLKVWRGKRHLLPSTLATWGVDTGYPTVATHKADTGYPDTGYLPFATHLIHNLAFTFIYFTAFGLIEEFNDRNSPLHISSSKHYKK